MERENSRENEPLLIVILGCTGTGKSKLSIEISRQIEGEIISADSMQVYEGLDIVTNKVTKEEQARVKHHLLDFVKPNDIYSVVKFQATALEIISDLHRRKKIPVIVGGTNYYIESLLWDQLINELEKSNEHINSTFRNDELNEDNSPCNANADHAGGSHSGILNLNVDESNSKEGVHEDKKIYEDNLLLHKELASIDPEMAKILHPNDRRKIKRSLQVYQRSGMRHSELLAQQHSLKGSTNYSGPMRFNNVCVLWLQCAFETLDKRLDARVDKMIEMGLVKELVDFYVSWKTEMADSSIGILQSIGFKEFRKFLELGYQRAEQDPVLFQKCVDDMKSATRRYARRQVRWVKNRFLGRPSNSSPDVYGLDATNLELWEDNVLGKAVDIVKCFRHGDKVNHAPLERVVVDIKDKHANHVCEVCNNRIIIGNRSWEAHQHSKSHRHHKKLQTKKNKVLAENEL